MNVTDKIRQRRPLIDNIRTSQITLRRWRHSDAKD